jgi:hypothetical protein
MTAALAHHALGERKARPILFSDAMVRAILEGKKTQTRRLVRWRPYREGQQVDYAFSGLEAGYYHGGVPSSGWVLRSRGYGSCWNDRTKPEFCPFGDAGDLLWVREAWAPCDHMTSISGSVLDDPNDIAYRADLSALIWQGEGKRSPADTRTWGWKNFKWRPSIYLPRWASRITLEVTQVRVQRLHEITGEDAIAEGLACLTKDGQTFKYGIADRDGAPGNDDLGWHWREWNVDPRAAYARLWNQINGDRYVARWDANPWVWAISFRRVQP